MKHLFLGNRLFFLNRVENPFFLDLFIVPLLIWRRTRIPAFSLALAFHLINARWFTIGVFPYLAIAASTLFFSPTWPRRLFSVFRPEVASVPMNDGGLPSLWRQWTTLSLVTIYLSLQILVPLRHLLYPGKVNWTHEGHRFSWRMMLTQVHTQAYFYVTDPNVDRAFQVKPWQHLSELQADKMAYRPDMILQFAHYLAMMMPQMGPKPLSVEARIFVSLNGRKPELFVDPNVDLAAERRSLKHARWLLPMREPLARISSTTSWMVPLTEPNATTIVSASSVR